MLEQELSRTLRAAARSVPPVEEDLLSKVLAGRTRHRRHQRHQTLLAAGTVLAVVLLVVAMVRLLPREAGVSQVPQPTRGIWSKAVFAMPKNTADGKPYRIVAMAGRARPVIAVEDSRGQLLRLDVYDADTRAFTTLDDMSGDAPIGCHDAVASDGRRVYWAVTPDDPVLRIMSAPVSGGRPSVVANAPIKGRMAGDCPERLQLSGGQVVFSEPDGGVFQVPATGGTVREVPRSAGLRLEVWPWATDDLVPADAGSPTRLVNLATGEVRRVRAGRGMTDLVCSVTTCAGILPDPRDNRVCPSKSGDALGQCAPPGRLAVQDLGGSKVRPLERFGWVCGLVLDRFVVSSRHQAGATPGKAGDLGLYPVELLVSDLRTGERTVVRDQWEAGCPLPGIGAEATPWLSWPDPKAAGRVLVLDLTAR